MSIVVLTHKIRCIIIPNKKDNKKANGYEMYINKDTNNLNKIANRINSPTSNIAILKIRYEWTPWFGTPSISLYGQLI